MSRPWIFEDYPRYAETFLRVKHPDSGILVPFRFKPIQQRLNATIDAALHSGRPARVLVLKSRRLGVSTLVAGKFFHRVATRPHQRGQVIAHRGADAATIFSIYERMHQNLPETWQGYRFRPQRAGGRGKALTFQRMDSSLEVGSAQSLDTGRGGDLQVVHLSEAAFFPDPVAFLAALLPQIPATGDNIVVLESTSNGPRGWWHDLWQQSEDGASGYTPLFFAWWEDPWHRLTPALVPETYTEEERALADQYGVTGEQLAWLRYQLEVTCFGNVSRRRREYPSSVEDCWVSVGEPGWPSEVLFRCYQRQAPLWSGTLTKTGIVKDPEGALTVWEEPQGRAEYVIGADIAAGLDTSNLCTGEIWRVGRKPGQWPVQVAEWAGHQDPITFAETLTLLGYYYHKALLAVEVTGIGRPTQTALQKTYFYPKLHRWMAWDAYKARGDTWGWECVDPEALVLTEELRWVPAGLVKTGERLIGYCENPPSEGRGSGSPLRMQHVVAQRLFIAPVVAITLENGQRTRVSTTHPFWSGTPDGMHWRWTQAADLQPGQLVKYLEVLRAVGSLRFVRFQSYDLEDRTLGALVNVRIQRVEPVGDDAVVGLTTEPDHTLIADGIIGHNTSWKSKQNMLGIADWLFRTQHVVIRSPALMKELVNYQQVSPDVYEGVLGDDRVMGAFIAWVSWFQNVFPGVPLKELRPTLVKLYGAATPLEADAPPRPAPDLSEWADAPPEQEERDSMAWRPSKPRVVAGDW